MKNQILKNIKRNVTALWDKDRTKIRLSPQRDWTILLVTFSLFLIGLVSANVWLFSQIDEEKIFFTEIVGDVSTETINIKAFKSTTELFKGKEQKFDDLIENKPRIIDPSR